MCPIGHWEVTQGTGHFHLEKIVPHAAVDPASLLPPWLSTLPPVTGKCEKHLLRFPNLPPRKAPTPLRTNGVNIPLRPHQPCAAPHVNPLSLDHCTWYQCLKCQPTNMYWVCSLCCCAEATEEVRYACAQAGLGMLWTLGPSSPSSPSSLFPPPSFPFPDPFSVLPPSLLSPPFLPCFLLFLFSLFLHWSLFPPFSSFFLPFLCHVHSKLQSKEQHQADWIRMARD